MHPDAQGTSPLLLLFFSLFISPILILTLTTPKGHQQGVYAICVVDDVIVSCSGDNTIRIWDSKTGTCHKILEGHKRHVMAIKVVGNTIYSGSSDKTIKVWEFS